MFIEDPSLCFQIRQGLERETLRVDMQGTASNKGHPQGLGCKLTHPFITTDYSENLVEFITPVAKDTDSLMQKLRQLHAYTWNSLDNEMLWPLSMPAKLPPNENDIPLADYGDSNVGRLKTLYRRGLGNRYGRSMQSISGVHYNFSFSDSFWNLVKEKERFDGTLEQLKSQRYFHMVRNFHRKRWVLNYLFGASPMVHESFMYDKKHSLEKSDKDFYYSPYATSLRMGGLGYTSQAQQSINICYNKLESYIHALEQARLTPYAGYEQIGLKRNGEYQQLNTHILQIDNEFYTNIRPKNVARTRESALQALHLRGVEYLEVRLLDNDPYHSLGISEETINFTHLFLMWCFIHDSPEMDRVEFDLADENMNRVVTMGRDPKTTLYEQGKEIALKEVLMSFLNEMSGLVKALESVEPLYKECFELQIEKAMDSHKLPSQKVLDDIMKKGFLNFGVGQAERFGYQLKQERADFSELEQLMQSTWDDERRIREEDVRDFDEFLEYYFEKIKI